MTIPKYTPTYKPSSLSSLPPIVLGALAGMDVQGELILGTWLYGGGVDHDVRDDPTWTPYMMADRVLAGQVFINLKPEVDKLVRQGKLGRFPIALRFHAQFAKNSGLSGYALLHGSNASAGDFLIAGFAEVAEAFDPVAGDYDIELDLHYVFNDIVDPNGNYWTDTVRAAVARAVTNDSPRNYKLSIGWGATCLVEVRHGDTTYYGYPSPLARPVRPLPAGKLDIAALERKRAAELEAQILVQLKRKLGATDVAGLADRKRRLLWLFYSFGSYWSSTYLGRLNSSEDELARLCRERLSSELRKEIERALLGKRPAGSQPTWADVTTGGQKART